jgi:DNA modification methylase
MGVGGSVRRIQFLDSLTAVAVAEQLDRRWIAGETVEEYLKAGTFRFEGFSQNPMLF